MMIDTCSWDAPGHDRYTGSVAAAIAHYNLPSAVVAELNAKIDRNDFDVVEITNDGIQGKTDTYTDLRMMHFAAGNVCRHVKWHWNAGHVETALAYCSGTTCVVVPSTCGNVSLATRVPAAKQEEVPAEGGGGVVSLLTVEPQPVAPAYVEPLAEIPPTVDNAPPDHNWPPLLIGPPTVTYMPPIYVPEPCGCDLPPPPPCPVPEPGTWELIIGGLIAVLYVAWRKVKLP